MILKDASHLGDRFITRGVAEGLCGLVAAWWLLLHVRNVRWSQHAMLLAYLAVVFVTSFFSDFRTVVLIQFASLLTVVLFGITIRHHPHGAAAHHLLMETTFWSYLAVILISLLLLKLAPQLVYQIGNIAGWKRFAGLYDRPAMLGAASGILVGIALFGSVRGSWAAAAARVLAVIGGLTCIYMSGARTFWVALLVALPLTTLVKYPSRIRLVVLTTLATSIAFALYQAFDIHISERTEERALRVESARTLTGRTEIWAAAAEAIQLRPATGFGLGMGGVALAHGQGRAASLIKERHALGLDLGNTPSLHSGYVQALGDSGVLGALLYIAIVVVTCLRYWRRKVAMQAGAECFIVIYLATANIAESVIYKASVWHSVLFWYLAASAPVIVPQWLSRRIPETHRTGNDAGPHPV